VIGGSFTGDRCKEGRVSPRGKGENAQTGESIVGHLKSIARCCLTGEEKMRKKSVLGCRREQEFVGRKVEHREKGS